MERSFELVTARHPVRPDWAQIHRVLKPGGCYFAQHVGPASAFELIEYFLGPLAEERKGRDPHGETAAARESGLAVVDLRTTSCRMEFYDVGAIVWILRKCIWWVPDFSVEKYRDRLVELDAQMRAGRAVVAYSTRHLIEARRPASHQPIADRAGFDVENGLELGFGKCRRGADICGGHSSMSVVLRGTGIPLDGTNRWKWQRLVVGVDLKRIKKAIGQEQQEATERGVIGANGDAFDGDWAHRIGCRDIGATWDEVDGAAPTHAALLRRQHLRLVSESLDACEVMG